MKTPEEFLESKGFVADKLDRRGLIAAFIAEMEAGLKGEPSSLLMIPSYISTDGEIPSGSSAAVLDAGGTNFRGAVVSLPPAISEKQNQAMPGTHGEVDEETFYGAFVNEIRRVQGKANARKIGFCFSYPAECTPDGDAKLIRWTKGVQAPAIIGQLVGSEITRRLDGKTPLVVLNDTVATLLAGKATEGDRPYSSYLGFILGTGTNTAYVEKNVNIVKATGLNPSGTMIINSESGNFDKVPQSEFDVAVDRKTTNAGEHFFEKMISGAYLGPLGLEIYKAAAKEGYFSSAAANRIGGLAALETMDFDNFCAGFRKEGRDNVLDAIFVDEADQRVARRLGLPVFERAAILTAIHLAAFAIKTGAGGEATAPININIDGSTYYKTRAIPFDASVRRELDALLVAERNVHYAITQVDDAPMVGAGVAAML